MTVYIVESGTQYEGGGVLDVFANRDAAIEHCRQHAQKESDLMVDLCRKDEIDADDWVILDRTAEWPGCELALHWGCYYVQVRSWEVRQ